MIFHHRFGYRIAGMTVSSDLELPAAATGWAPQIGPPDITIAAAAVPFSLHGAERRGPDWEIDGNAFLLRVDSVARFLIIEGQAILYDEDASHQSDGLPLFLLGTCLAILLGQRGRLVFHASAVSIQGRALLFCGDSGAGKSTLAARLGQQGYPLLSDDICSLAAEHGRGGAGRMMAGTDGRMLKLWQPAITQLALQAQRGRAVQQEAEKFYLRPPAEKDTRQPLGAVCVLETGKDDEPPTLERLSAVAAMNALTSHVYRPALMTALHMESAYFAGCAAMQRQAPVYRLRRPLRWDRMEDVVTLIEEHWRDFPGLEGDFELHPALNSELQRRPA